MDPSDRFESLRTTPCRQHGCLLLRSLYTSPENGQKMAKSSVFWRFFGTFWAITWPINAQWASNWQESQLVCSQSHSDALNTLVGCQELTGVCLRRVPGAKKRFFWVFWRLFGTFWVITSPINVQWASNCQGS